MSAELASLQSLLARDLAAPSASWSEELLGEIVPGGTLDAAGALEVYRAGYLARLSEQLGESYATVWRVLGDSRFFEIAASYIARHPSSSYNLSDYGREFPDFLATLPDCEDSPFLPELARFELAFHDLFHSEAEEGMDAAALAALGDLSDVKLRLVRSLRLVSCECAVYELFRRREDSEAPEIDIERPQQMLLYRQGGEVLARELDAAGMAMLRAFEEGLDVEAALDRACAADESFGAAEVTAFFEMLALCGIVASASR